MEHLQVSQKAFLDPKRIRTGAFYLTASGMGAGIYLSTYRSINSSICYEDGGFFSRNIHAFVRISCGVLELSIAH